MQPGKDADLTGKPQCYHFSVNRAGYVMTGGRSSRMGRDKALLRFHGRPLVETVARAVEDAAGSAVLVGNPALSEFLSYPVIPDLYPGEGPLGGILTGLRHTAAHWNLVAACDMPELTSAFLAHLLDAAADSDADVLMPIGRGGQPEPLCAVYRLSARDPIQAAFDAGVRKVTAALAGLRICHLTVPDFKPFQNVNTPEDWAVYAAG